MLSRKGSSALTIFIEALDFGGKLEGLGVLALDLVDELAEEATRRLGRGML